MIARLLCWLGWHDWMEETFFHNHAEEKLWGDGTKARKIRECGRCCRREWMGSDDPVIWLELSTAEMARLLEESYGPGVFELFAGQRYRTRSKKLNRLKRRLVELEKLDAAKRGDCGADYDYGGPIRRGE